jgi:cytochrome P450
MALRIEDVDLFSPETQEDWYPAYRAILEQSPVYRIPQTGHYLISKFEDIAWIVRNPERFPNNAKGSTGLLLSEEAQAYYREHGYPRQQPLGTNPPEHRKYREQVDPFFSPAGARKQEAMIRRTINELIDQWIDRGEIEFVQDFAVPLPVHVITRMLGFPMEDIPRLRVWSAAWVMPFAMGLTHEQQMYVAEKGVEFQKYIEGFIDERRANPGEDVISHLATTKFDGERPLTNAEIIGMIDHLYIGGNETTTFALTSGLWLLMRNPGLWEELKADRSKVRFFVEEVLRLESPTQGLFRVTTQDEEIRGVKIPAGSVLHLRFAAANRDPDEFPDPDKLDLSRPNVGRHLAFSQGEHMCPGAGLSRFEQNMAWNILLDRIDRFELVPGKNDFTHLPGFVLRALKELHVSFTRT